MLNLDECDDLLFASYWNKGAKLKGLDSETRDLTGMAELFRRAQIPAAYAPTMIVTGSKGKGSTSILAAAILQGCGLKVGLVTSPSYLSLRERMRVNGHSIPAEDYLRIVNNLAPLIREIDDSLPSNKYLSPTGLFLAVAMRYFVEQKVEVLVLEVGRGGRFDDINLMNNQIACFTPITDEHFDKLGPTRRDLAWHKVGIIKPNGAVISAGQFPDVIEMIRDEATKQHCRLHTVGEDIAYTHSLDGVFPQATVELKYLPQKHTFSLNNPGIFLGENLAVAYAAAQEITHMLALSEPDVENINSVVRRTRFPGRTDRIHTQPTVFVDGAINRSSARQFRESVLAQSPEPRVLVTALPEDKDYVGLLDELAPYVTAILVTRVTAGHLVFQADVYHYAQQVCHDTVEEPHVFAAFQAGMDKIGATGTLWVVGTQSLVRDALAYWEQNLDQLQDRF